MIIKLKKNQFDFLNHSLSEKQKLLKLKVKEISQEIHFVFIEIDVEMADEIRDWACEELQKKGFDINYELTPEGKILEELIDLFYVK